MRCVQYASTIHSSVAKPDTALTHSWLGDRGDAHHRPVHRDREAARQLADEHERVALEPLQRRLVRVPHVNSHGVLSLGQLRRLAPAVVNLEQLIYG